MSDEARRLARLERDLDGVSPYPGLRPFLETESRFFKGREAQIHEIGHRLAAKNCVAVLGGSGCGKSSIVRAGVVPALRRKLIPGRGDLWRDAIFTPGEAPMDKLVSALASTLRESSQEAGAGAERSRMIRRVLYGPMGLGGFVPTFLDQLDIDPGLSPQARKQANLLVVIDQFEELFRPQVQGKVQVARLIELVIDYWKRRNQFPGLYLIITMRSDDLHRCAEFLELPDFINATSYLTRRLEEIESREAIVAPIRPPMFRAGLIAGELPPGEIDLRPFEVRVVTELLDATREIAYDPDHLPLLQHLLAVLWRQVRQRWEQETRQSVTTAWEPVITLDDLAAALGFDDWNALRGIRGGERSGHTDGWLLRHCLQYAADQVYKGDRYGPPLSGAQQKVAETALCLMGEIDDRGNYKRCYTDREEIALVVGPSASHDDVDAFVRRFFQDHRLIWVRDDGLMDVSHESLMRNWPRLRNWLIQDREAGNAYRELGKNYRKWKQTDWHFARWWLGGSSGLLGRDTLDSMIKRLAPDSGILRVVPRYTAGWARRYESARSAGAVLVGDDASASGSQTEAEFHRRLAYLSWNKRLSNFIKALPLVILVLISAWGWYTAEQQRVLAQQQRVLAQQQTERVASDLWDGFGGTGFSPDSRYVDNLWRLVGAEPEVREQFVVQLARPGNLKQIALNPLPVVRAVGLVWRQAQQDQFSADFKQRLGELPHDNISDAMLACATAAIADRLDKKCYAKAIGRFKGFIKKELEQSKLDWSVGRVLACLGPALYAADKKATEHLFNRIFQEADQRDGRLEASGMAVVAWLQKAHGRELNSDQVKTVTAVLPQLIDILKNRSAGPWAIRSARSLISLLVVVPSQVQIKALELLLSAVDEWPEEGDPDVVLVLAQGFEIIARQYTQEGKSQALVPLVDKAHELLQRYRSAGAKAPDETSSAEDGRDAPSAPKPEERRARIKGNRFFVARLLAPLIEATAVSGPELDELAQTAGFEGPLDCSTARPIVPEDGSYQLRRTGLRARVLALAVRHHCPLDWGGGPEAVQNLIGFLNNSGMTQYGRPQQFPREAVARALAALAERPNLDEQTRGQALESARIALAETGSAEEGAAWAEAITQLLHAEKDDVRYVEQLVDILKYPNSALISREPNAREPRSATDIMIAALIKRLKLNAEVWNGSIGDAAPRFKVYRKVLEKLVRNPRFKQIKLDERPTDPRKKTPAADSIP